MTDAEAVEMLEDDMRSGNFDTGEQEEAVRVLLALAAEARALREAADGLAQELTRQAGPDPHDWDDSVEVALSHYGAALASLQSQLGALEGKRRG